MNYILVVDDKAYGRESGVEVSKRLGYDDEHIIVARYGDDALNKFKRLHAEGKLFDVVISDQHMDIVHKPHEGDLHWTKTPEILSGTQLTEEILKLKPEQNIIIVSGSLDKIVKKRAFEVGAKAVMYKRKARDEKFEEYVGAIKTIIDGRVLNTEETTHLLHNRGV